jgi:hypothetical protein
MKKLGIWAMGFVMLGVLAAGANLRAQGDEMSKPPVYIYVSDWAVPRAQWGEMAKVSGQQRALEDKLLDDGTITGYGEFENVIHTEGEPTHGSWITANSEQGIVEAVQAFMSRPDTTAPVLAASQHSDHFLVSRMHNARPGKYDGAYLAGLSWQVKPGQFEAFRDLLKARVVPTYEKLLADGVLVSYSIDMQDYITAAPDTVDLVVITTDASGLDKVDQAFQGVFGKDPEIGPAMGSLTKAASRRDFLYRVNHLAIK